ncbi:m16 family peptidase [Bacillus sp. OxB-1]|uniref:M16 family metallopeptidase n=1 Tax=Bacillus sp. (strain OxB-1) TaxID=98228 RepID=UPI000581FF8B|nr:pitrilysin family protein [Bacillus sp. OxB-1]BAQ10568.1 m16 family peptidase [Bacillus sp. OxB-1]
MVEKVVCPNGARIVHEKMEHVRSVAIGIWVKAGSGNEQPSEAGIAHFIEHMLFKGTVTRTAKEIAEQFDRIGGDINAFTSKEMTCFYATVLHPHARTAVSVLGDMFFHSRFDEKEIAKEQSVVLDEIAAVADTPDDDVEEKLWSLMYPAHPIGRPVLGQEETIRTFDEKRIRQFMERHYTPERLVISIAGNYDESLLTYIADLFGSFEREPQEEIGLVTEPVFHPGALTRIRDIEQAHVCIAYPALTLHDERIYALSILDSVIGGTMSSRLFQEVREERGLAYSVYSYYTTHEEAGAFLIYGGTSPENMEELTETIQQIVEDIVKDGVTANELHNAKEQLKGGFLLGLESSEAIMQRNGRVEILFQKHRSPEEVVALIDQVTAEQVHQLASGIFSKPQAVSRILPRA